MQKIKGGLQILGGLGLWVLGVTLGVSWLVFCFGSVIVGLLLLFLAPGLLLAPFGIGMGTGTAMLALGFANWHGASDMGEPSATQCEGDPWAAQRDMSDGVERTPSWAMDPRHRDQFLKGIQVEALRAGVSQQFIVEKFEDKDIFRLFVQYSGNLEHHKCSFATQQKEVSALIVKQWRQTRAISGSLIEDS